MSNEDMTHEEFAHLLFAPGKHVSVIRQDFTHDERDEHAARAFFGLTTEPNEDTETNEPTDDADEHGDDEGATDND
ncbi:hypothetical protein [Kytococcus sedentarius]|uniref:hypothetical protein n=1 Tax=Kytococcus sedentarius TaxID=1276 RepID=UPI0035BBB176